MEIASQQSCLEQIKRLLNMDKQDKLPDKMSKLEALLQGNRFLDMVYKEDRVEYHKILYNATFEQYHPKSIIQILGNYANKFYIIVEGKVDVFIRDKKDEDCLYGARQLVDGDCMNEIALVTGDKSLVQYQVCESEGDCSVMVLQKKEFLQIQNLINIQLEMSLFYMKNLPLFWNQNERHMHMFFLLTTHEKFVKNQEVFLEGDKSDLVYIISQGEFGVYKHFQDLQFRKLNDVNHNKYLDSLGTTTVKLQEFHHNKNIQTKILKENEMFGEEDIISRRTRSYSVICESMDGDLIVMSKATFKILLMGNEGVRNYILSKLKVKQTEISRILDKQAGQVSSARIHILERDQLKIATTQDFVKSRSFLNMSRQIYGSNMSRLGESILTNNNNSSIIENQNSSYVKNNRYDPLGNNIKVLKSIPREPVNHILNSNNASTTNINKKTDPQRLSLPQINQYDNALQQQMQQQTVSTKNIRPIVNQPKRYTNSQERIVPYTINLHSQDNENYYQQPAQPSQQSYNLFNINTNESKVFNPSASQLQQIQKQDDNTTTSKRAQIDNINLSYEPNVQSINIPTPKQQMQTEPQNYSSQKPLSSSQLESGTQTNLQEKEKTERTNKAGENTNRRDSKFFDNFTRNSTLYLQKYQINQEKKQLFSVGKRNDQSDEVIDVKGRQLSDQIQSYIQKYEQQMNKFLRAAAKTQEDYHPIASTKVLYKKPLTEDDYLKIQKKQQEDELETMKNQNKERNYKINFYQKN